MTAEERMRAIIAPLHEALRDEQASHVIGPASLYHERAITSAFEDALVGMLVKRGVITRSEWEEAFLGELQVKVAAVMAAIDQSRKRR